MLHILKEILVYKILLIKIYFIFILVRAYIVYIISSSLSKNIKIGKHNGIKKLLLSFI